MGKFKRNGLYLYNRILSLVLILLGFSACSNDDEDDNLRLMYGHPPVTFSVKTQVVDENNKPIEGIQVAIKTDNNRILKSGLSDAKGEYATGIAYDQINIVYSDIDGDKNGAFKNDSVQVNLYEINGGLTYEHKMTLKAKE